MPAYMKCEKCGFDGPHGFNDPGVGGIITFYHSTPTGTCRTYTVKDQWFTEWADAWRCVRPDLVQDRADPDWLAAWDALIIEKNQKKHQRLLEVWRVKFDT